MDFVDILTPLVFIANIWVTLDKINTIRKYQRNEDIDVLRPGLTLALSLLCFVIMLIFFTTYGITTYPLMWAYMFRITYFMVWINGFLTVVEYLLRMAQQGKKAVKGRMIVNKG